MCRARGDAVSVCEFLTVGRTSPGRSTPLSIAPRRSFAIFRYGELAGESTGDAANPVLEGLSATPRGRAGIRPLTVRAARWSASDVKRHRP